jgi:methylthioribose-1-phosphate isomerase
MCVVAPSFLLQSHAQMAITSSNRAASAPAANPGFDVTPARLVTVLNTERGLCAANEGAIGALFPEHG